MKLAITHTLRVPLGTPARAVQHVLLTPLGTPQQKIERWTIEMPGFADAATFRDGFGNKAHLVSQVKPEAELVAVARGVVETIDRAGVLGRLEYDPMPALFRRPTARATADPELVEAMPTGGGRIAMLHELMGAVHGRRQIGAQSQSQDAEGQRQAQDAAAPNTMEMAQLFIGCARALDVPARYVTGYLIEDQAARVHAWAEAWDEGLGWIGFDCLLNLCPTTEHVRLASGLDATGTVPIRTVPAPLGEIAQSVELGQEPPST